MLDVERWALGVGRFLSPSSVKFFSTSQRLNIMCACQLLKARPLRSLPAAAGIRYGSFQLFRSPPAAAGMPRRSPHHPPNAFFAARIIPPLLSPRSPWPFPTFVFAFRRRSAARERPTFTSFLN
jgi:hypothetical protein